MHKQMLALALLSVLIAGTVSAPNGAYLSFNSLI
jgi:hypothetical protein